MMKRQELKKLIEKIYPGAVFELYRSFKSDYGDFSTNIAMVMAKKTGQNSIQIAKTIEKEMKDLFERIEVIGPGFINFFLFKEDIQEELRSILKKDFGDLKIGKDKKVQIEFISANPTGPLTVGNARGGPFGDVLGNVFKRAGFKVEKAYYVNDCGMQIETLGHSVLKDEQAKYKGKYIEELNKRIKEKDPYKAGEQASLIILNEMIKKTVERMKIKYDEWFLESNLHKEKKIEKVLGILDKKGLIYEKEGAKWFKSSEYGDKRDRVVVKANNHYTYLAGDIAYHRYKFEKKKFDRVINIWGADHQEDAPGVKAAVQALGHKGKLEFIFLQFVTLFEKGKELKMSKRQGNYVTMEELLNSVGSDITRFFFLQKGANTHLNFDLSLAKEQSEKNPVYYIQYAFVRINSIFKKAKNQKPSAKNLDLLNHPSELKLIKQLAMFSDIIEDTVEDYQVQRIPQYATDLSSYFHRFYRDCRVLSEDKNLNQARLSLVLATKLVLKKTLDMMGISAPDKM